MHRLAQSLGPLPALALIGLPDTAHQLAHDRDRHLIGEVGQEVAASRRIEAVEQFRDKLLGVAAELVDRLWCEVRREQTPHTACDRGGP